MQAKYHGPYTVLEQLGPVDYVIATPDRRKTKRVCHINLLKQYHVRDAILCPPVDTAVSDYVGIADSVQSDALPPSEPQLSKAQNFELMSLISEFVRVINKISHAHKGGVTQSLKPNHSEFTLNQRVQIKPIHD